ncbi:MAG: hypothetical protein WD431_16590 [Cyclobacteriaceae bacterium]
MVFILAFPYWCFPQQVNSPNLYPRFIENGDELPSKTYADQHYVIVDGFPEYAISNDDGKSFSTPQIMRYANGEPMGNTRACPKIHKTKDGKFLFWYHNNFNQNLKGKVDLIRVYSRALSTSESIANFNYGLNQ